MSNPLLEIAQAADKQISAIHAALGAPGDYGYESREGQALYELCKFQVELRAAIRQSQIEDVRGLAKPKSDTDVEALDRLINLAKSDTGQARRAADFLLAWWNGANCGHFDLTNLWGVDGAIADDMQTVFGFIARIRSYPDSLGYAREFHAIIARWHPELLEVVQP